MGTSANIHIKTKIKDTFLKLGGWVYTMDLFGIVMLLKILFLDIISKL